MDAERSGDWYLPGSEESQTQHLKTFTLTREFNALGNTDPVRTQELLSQLFAPGSSTPEIWGPLHPEYGVNTTFGSGCFMNFNCVILDIARITIGEGTLFGPACQLITVQGHLETSAAYGSY